MAFNSHLEILIPSSCTKWTSVLQNKGAKAILRTWVDITFFLFCTTNEKGRLLPTTTKATSQSSWVEARTRARKTKKFNWASKSMCCWIVKRMCFSVGHKGAKRKRYLGSSATLLSHWHSRMLYHLVAHTHHMSRLAERIRKRWRS